MRATGGLSDAGKTAFREKIMQGGGDIKGVRVAETVALYTIYLKKMMGILQAKEIEEGRGENLPAGRLQYWQFFYFKTKYHYRLLEKEAFEAAVLDKLGSGGVKMHCLADYN